MSLKKIVWLAPTSTPGTNVMTVWGQYLERLGWELADEKANDAKLIFCGSESQIERAVRCKVELKIPLICYCWGFPYFRIANDKTWQEFYFNKIKLLRECDLLLTPSSIGSLQLADWCLDSLTIPPGIDDQLISSVSEQDVKTQVVVVGRLVQHKRADLVIRAVSMLKIPFEVVLIGRGEQEELLRNYALTLGVNLRIETEYNDYQKIKEIKQSLVLISASEYEGFGMPVMEGIWANRPVLVRDTPYYRWYFKDRVQFFEGEEQLAELILKMLSPTFRTVCLESSKVLKEHYSFTAAANRLGLLLGGLISDLEKQRLGNNLRQSKTKEDYIRIYEENADREITFHFKDYFKNDMDNFRLGLIIPHIVGPAILDMGCSHGLFAIEFAKLGYQVTAIDIATKNLTLAIATAKQENLNIKFHHKLIEATGFKNETFNTIWAGEIIEHLPRPEKLILEAFRLLKPNGRLIGTTPYKDNYPSPLHLRTWDEKQLRKLFSAAAFNVVRYEIIRNPHSNQSHFFFVLAKPQCKIA